MPDALRSPYQYAVIRVVPRVERGEALNAGVVLLCRPLRFLDAVTALDERRLAAFAPDGGPIAALTQPERFHWLVSPSSTILQPSAVHTGLTDDPAAELAHLVESLVR